MRGGDADGCRLLTTSAIVTPVQLWARSGRAPSPVELCQAGVRAEHASCLAPLVRVLRSVPQIRTWSAASATQADPFMLDLADDAD